MTRRTTRYYSLSDYLREHLGYRAFRVGLYCGFTCPNRDGTKGSGGCIYCEPSTLIPRGVEQGMTVTEQIDLGIERIRKRYRTTKVIAYFQVNTSTYSNPQHLKNLYTEALRHPDVAILSVSTRPDCVDEEIFDLLVEIKKEKPLWLELGLQSASNSTLRLINRGYTVEDFSRAVDMAHERGIQVCAHVILGLPGETRKDMLNTMRYLSCKGVWGVKFHHLQVIRGTPLEGMYRSGRVRVLELEEYIDLVVECLELLKPHTVVHRLVGDVPGRFLIAPQWGAGKQEIIEGIIRRLEQRNTFQGARL